MKGVIKQIRRGLRNYGFFVTVAMLPTLLWLLTVDAPTGDTLELWLRACAKIAAFSAIGFFLVSVILITRLPIVERLCNGLDRAYVLHRWMAKLTLGFAAMHVALLLAYAMTSNSLSPSDVFDLASPAVLLGILSIVMTIALIVTAITKKIRHQSWVWLHRIFSTSMIWGWLHVLLSSGDAADSPVLWWTICVIGVVAIIAWVYRVTAPLLTPRYKYEVAEVNPVDEHVTELVLKPTGKEIDYRSGQYAWLSIDDPAVDKEAHPFSFATADNGPLVRFTVKQLGDYTKDLRQVAPGARAWIEGPYGRLDMHNCNCPYQIWIAGGIGLAPFLSMARDMDHDIHSQVNLIYGFHDQYDAAFLLELRDIEALTRGRFRVTPVNEEVSGYITLDWVKACTPDINKTMFMLCGPPTMMNAIIKQLLSIGVERDRIHAEEFAL